MKRWPAIAALVAMTVVALVLYRPWAPRPFDLVDFSEFLPFLVDGTGPFDRLGRFCSYYIAEHGRLNPVSYVGLVLKWELFGRNVALWQWSRVLELELLATGVYLLIRRLDTTRLAAITGASLFVVSRISGEAWTRLTMGEPLGLLLVLGAALLATKWRSDPSPRRGAMIGALVLAAILAKEMMIGVVPFVWLVGAARDEEGRFGAWGDRGATRTLFGWTMVPALAGFGAAALVALQGQGEGFTTQYGAATPSVTLFLDGWQRPWQVQGLQNAPGSWLLPANTLLALLSIAGSVVAWRIGGAERRHLLWVAGGALLLGATYSALYLPWPFFYLYHVIPFLLGPALLLAVAMTAIERHAATHHRWALLAWGVMLVAAAGSTARTTWTAIALQQTHGDVMTAIAAHPGIDTVIVARARSASLSWTGTGARLRSVATAFSLPFPPAIDELCQPVAERIAAGLGAHAVVNYLHRCGGLPMAPNAAFRREAPWFGLRWTSISTGVDTLGADLLLPDLTPRSAPRTD